MLRLREIRFAQYQNNCDVPVLLARCLGALGRCARYGLTAIMVICLASATPMWPGQAQEAVTIVDHIIGTNVVMAVAAAAPICVSGAHCVILGWTAPKNYTNGTAFPAGAVLTYTVSRGTNTGGPYTAINATPVSGTSYEDDTAAGGTQYFYVVSATVTAGGFSSASANSAQSAAVVALPLPSPNAPTNVTATPN